MSNYLRTTTVHSSAKIPRRTPRKCTQLPIDLSTLWTRYTESRETFR
jgi:hypothetical protein